MIICDYTSQLLNNLMMFALSFAILYYIYYTSTTDLCNNNNFEYLIAYLYV